MISTLASAIIASALCVLVIALAAICVFKAVQTYYLAKAEKGRCVVYYRNNHVIWKDKK